MAHVHPTEALHALRNASYVSVSSFNILAELRQIALDQNVINSSAFKLRKKAQ